MSAITFHVTPHIPPALEPLRELAYNLWWSWHADARWLFWRLDPALWHSLDHSPVKMLQQVGQAKLTEAAMDSSYIRQIGEVAERFRAYLAAEQTWAESREGLPFTSRNPVAYFSFEFGLHESLPIYSGGLGILSGDHVKSASDLGLPFVAVGLLYRHGYFRQQVTRDGRQEALDMNQNFRDLPIRETLRDGEPVSVSVALPDRAVAIKVWEMSVGRTTLYLLDTDVPANRPDDRAITGRLYGGDKDMRMRQEIVLGIGGKRVLAALGLEPEVFHMNEGHSAFLSLERIRQRVEQHGLDFRSALQIVAASNVFTTHTPVPAGNEVFPVDMLRYYMESFAGEIGLTFDELAAMGQSTENPDTSNFSMTILALRTSRHANGVSAIHGRVSRGMWRGVWAGVPEDEVPITHVTNGVHTRSWLAPEIAALYDRYVGKDWDQRLTDIDYFRRVAEIPPEELWATHQHLKGRLVDFARVRLRRQRERNGEPPEKIRETNVLLDPEILTIGFARRFATYKRATLLFSQPERLQALLNHAERPVQFIFAGKAHPHDGHGQEFIRQVVEFSRRNGIARRLVFIEDYDACVGRRLYQGVDLWMNNPLRPMEASGTSGMKPPPNGGLNLSVLDGWWAEAWNQRNGWAIGEEISDGPSDVQDAVDAESLYTLLETRVVPLFYARADGRLPLAWIDLMRESMRTVTPRFNTHRMVSEYCEKLYEPAARAGRALAEDACLAARKLRDWKDAVRRGWGAVRIVSAESTPAAGTSLRVGDSLNVNVRLDLGDLKPEHVRVQFCLDRGEGTAIRRCGLHDLERNAALSAAEGRPVYTGRVTPEDSGEYALRVRVIPTHPSLTQPHELRLIHWWEC